MNNLFVKRLYTPKILYAMLNPLMWTGALLTGFMHNLIVPNSDLFLWCIMAIFVDILTGVIKTILAKGINGVKSEIARTKSFEKIVQYGGIILVTWAVASVIYKTNEDGIRSVVDIALYFVFFNEIISILENFRDMSPRSEAGKLISQLIKVIKMIKRKQALDITGTFKVDDASTPETPTETIVTIEKKEPHY